MPNRIIKESALDSEDLDTLSNSGERLFWRLILVADDYGRFEATPQVVKARCFPRRVDTMRTNEVEKAMKELSPLLVRFYSVGGRQYGCFLNWEKHQGSPRAKKSKFPDPPTEIEQNQPDSICKHLHANVPEGPNTNTDTNSDLKEGESPGRGSLIDHETWAEFRKMRQRIRRPLTDHAEALLLADLDKLVIAGEDAKEVVEQSIKNSWQGLFAVRNGQPAKAVARDRIDEFLKRGT